MSTAKMAVKSMEQGPDEQAEHTLHLTGMVDKGASWKGDMRWPANGNYLGRSPSTPH
jgi:hypothetical protein